ncbi:sensor histidine kinase [Verminephrobacter aporrectodeae]|uniref:sensor histidine kinase n=1 Tax=Verminephrobacter aporrectodeae TaxID=1110389 RepID=UPI002238C7F7|nr:ATP-binding protein [Verminephrobacter aporrectodeae]
MEVIFYTSCAFLLTVFVVSIVLAARGNQAAKYFLWIWAALMILALSLMNRANMISHIVAGLMLLFFLYVLYITVRYGMERVDVSHEETRRVLAESNRRIDEERRTLARRLHDEVNPQILLTRNVLKQLEPLVAENARASELLGNASGMLNDAYAEMRDIIKNTRIEVIDSVGFTAALGSLVDHYTNISEKPAITLENNLPKRPALSDASVINAYKIIREAIFNAIKHSNAAQVRVSVQHNKARDTYKVEISDNGIGMKAAARNGEHVGIGLIDMRERVRVLGGTLKVQAADPANQKRPGTKLSFSFSAQLS